MTLDEMKALHERSSKHREAIMQAGRVACFFCGSRFPASEIIEWCDHKTTAICGCGVDACLPDDGTITDEMLVEMEAYWFGHANNHLGSRMAKLGQQIAQARAAKDGE